MNLEILFIAAAVVIAFMVFKAVFGTKPMPPTRTFRCAKCSASEAYSPRTIEAWRKGIKRLYCQSCHRAWLNSQPKRMHSSSERTPGGCAPVVLLGVFLPAAIYATGRFIS